MVHVGTGKPLAQPKQEVQAADFEPKVQAADPGPKVQAANLEPKVQAADPEPKVQAANLEPKVPLDQGNLLQTLQFNEPSTPKPVVNEAPKKKPQKLSSTSIDPALFMNFAPTFTAPDSSKKTTTAVGDSHSAHGITDDGFLSPPAGNNWTQIDT